MEQCLSRERLNYSALPQQNIQGPQVETKMYLQPHPKSKLIILCQSPEIVKFHNTRAIILNTHSLTLNAKFPQSDFKLYLFYF